MGAVPEFVLRGKLRMQCEHASIGSMAVVDAKRHAGCGRVMHKESQRAGRSGLDCRGAGCDVRGGLEGC
jgi:hypothetical protein